MLKRFYLLSPKAKPNPHARTRNPPSSEKNTAAHARAPGRVAGFVNTVEAVVTRVTTGKARGMIIYLKDNVGGIFTYQLILEGLVTAYFFAGLQSGQFTLAGLRRIFIDRLCIPPAIFDFEGAEYESDYVVPYSGKVVDKTLMTNIHTAHNVAMAFIPLQMLFIFCSYPIAKHSWTTRIHPFLLSVPIVSKLVSRPTMPNEFADKIMWATAAQRNVGGAAPQAKVPTASKKSGFRR